MSQPTKLTSLPTEIMSLILADFTVSDLKNFRKASKWAQDESFDEFKARGYAKLEICDEVPCRMWTVEVDPATHHPNDFPDCSEADYEAWKAGCVATDAALHETRVAAIRRLAQTIQDSPQIAALVQEALLKLDQDQSSIMVHAAPLLSSLSKLKKLVIYSTKAGMVAQGFQPLADAASKPFWRNLIQLELKHCHLTGSELESILRQAGDGLTSMCFEDVTLTDCSWSDMLDMVQSSCQNLNDLLLRDLRGPKSRMETIGNNEFEVQFPKIFREKPETIEGEQGEEEIRIYPSAQMKGPQAAKLGLEFLVETLKIDYPED